MANPPGDAAPVTLGQGRFLKLVRRGQWEFVQRTNITGVVAIIAVTDQGQLLLVEQSRAPVNARCIELPAGLVGDEDAEETLEASAARELEEETGYRPGTLEILGSGVSSAGMADETVTFCRARGLMKVGPGGGDPDEAIQVHAVSVAEVPAFLEAGQADGRLVDLKIWAALWWLSRDGAGIADKGE